MKNSMRDRPFSRSRPGDHTMQNDFNEQDWKLFRKKLPDWQEAFMAELNEEYIRILSRDQNASDNFWELEKRLREDKRKTGVLARDIRRSNMISLMMDLIREGAISIEDLDGFSEELKERLTAYSQWT